MYNNQNVKCRQCRVVILQSTAISTNGLCMPCFKANNLGRTPDNLKSIVAHGLESIEICWQSFQKKRFPADLGGCDIDGICVSLLDTTVASCISSALKRYEDNTILDNTRLGMLRSSVSKLRLVIDTLDGEEKSYFNDLLWMATAIIDVCDKA